VEPLNKLNPMLARQSLPNIISSFLSAVKLICKHLYTRVESFKDLPKPRTQVHIWEKCIIFASLANKLTTSISNWFLPSSGGW